MTANVRILGIDPGLRYTGFGVIEVANKKPYYVVSGVIATDSKESLDVRLKVIAKGLYQIINEVKPTIASIEKVFVNSNPQSTLLLGQARGAAITACVLNDLNVTEYTALRVKKSVVGYGHAEKEQISKMVKLLLNLEGAIQSDAADALAVALTHMNHTNIHHFIK
jgi:crossover junction endodeoxyribonuclease RuvC